MYAWWMWCTKHICMYVDEIENSHFHTTATGDSILIMIVNYNNFKIFFVTMFVSLVNALKCVWRRMAGSGIRWCGRTQPLRREENIIATYALNLSFSLLRAPKDLLSACLCVCVSLLQQTIYHHLLIFRARNI